MFLLCVCVCVRVRACVHACVRAHARTRRCVWVCMCSLLFSQGIDNYSKSPCCTSVFQSLMRVQVCSFLCFEGMETYPKSSPCSRCQQCDPAHKELQVQPQQERRREEGGNTPQYLHSSGCDLHRSRHRGLLPLGQ